MRLSRPFIQLPWTFDAEHIAEDVHGIDAYLIVVPFIEIGLGLALISNRHKWLAVHAWFAFMLSLTVGHYILQEWSAVNQMLDYFFLGILCLVLPNHQSWLRRDMEQ